MIATVCSKWAEREPSWVTTVHLSGSVRVTGEPIVIIGSMASVIPARSAAPRRGVPKLGTWGSSWKRAPMPWPTSSRTTP